jgi:hypothetical protein
MIEHFFKLLELVPLKNHNNENVVYAFRVLVEIFTDQGMEFYGEF